MHKDYINAKQRICTTFIEYITYYSRFRDVQAVRNNTTRFNLCDLLFCDNNDNSKDKV